MNKSEIVDNDKSLPFDSPTRVPKRSRTPQPQVRPTFVLNNASSLRTLF